ncbi:hypothetical protein ACHZ98_32705 [Streptomyces sp. MAR4 CNY-716]
MESPVLGDGYAGFGERHGETDRWQHGTALRADSTGPPNRELALLDRAEEPLVDRCMDRNGLPCHPAPAATADELRDFPPSWDDPSWARRHAYGGDLSARQHADE